MKKIYHQEFKEDSYNKAMWLLRRTKGVNDWTDGEKKMFLFHACQMIEK